MKTEGNLMWEEVAAGVAHDAHENYFSSRRGIWDMEGWPGIVFIYNNNPYPEPSLRFVETCRFRALLLTHRFAEVAYAEYGGSDDPNYTYAMVVDLGHGPRRARMELLVDLYSQSTRKTLESGDPGLKDRANR